MWWGFGCLLLLGLRSNDVLIILVGIIFFFFLVCAVVVVELVVLIVHVVPAGGVCVDVVLVDLLL